MQDLVERYLREVLPHKAAHGTAALAMKSKC